jgi:hypothetical protein
MEPLMDDNEDLLKQVLGVIGRDSQPLQAHPNEFRVIVMDGRDVETLGQRLRRHRFESKGHPFQGIQGPEA